MSGNFIENIEQVECTVVVMYKPDREEPEKTVLGGLWNYERLMRNFENSTDNVGYFTYGRRQYAINRGENEFTCGWLDKENEEIVGDENHGGNIEDLVKCVVHHIFCYPIDGTASFFDNGSKLIECVAGHKSEGMSEKEMMDCKIKECQQIIVWLETVQPFGVTETGRNELAAMKDEFNDLLTTLQKRRWINFLSRDDVEKRELAA